VILQSSNIKEFARTAPAQAHLLIVALLLEISNDWWFPPRVSIACLYSWILSKNNTGGSVI